MWRQVDGSVISGRAMSFDVDDLTSKMRENSEQMLDLIIKQSDFGNVKVEREVLLGEPHAEILEISEKENFDLIVMGNRGFSNIKRFFVGSVTQRIISEAKCPVLVIHSDLDD
ncbi:MAG: universal stress protein [Oscillospiraceae bacterium]|nr:universal stress protein [Oscillospiraceae bacterium]